MKRIISAFLLFGMIVFTFAGCGGANGDGGGTSLNLIGTWTMSDVAQNYSGRKNGDTVTFENGKTNLSGDGKMWGYTLEAYGAGGFDGFYPVHIDRSSQGIDYLYYYIKRISANELEVYGSAAIALNKGYDFKLKRS